MEHVDERAPVLRHDLVRRKLDRAALALAGDVADTAHVRDLLARPQPLGQPNDRVLRHAVDKDVRLGVEEDRAPHAIGPVVVVRDAPQTGLDATKYDWPGVLEVLADQVRVDDDGAVGAAVVPATGGEIVGSLGLLRRRVVGHHRVDTAARDAPEELRFAQPSDLI